MMMALATCTTAIARGIAGSVLQSWWRADCRIAQRKEHAIDRRQDHLTWHHDFAYDLTERRRSFGLELFGKQHQPNVAFEYVDTSKVGGKNILHRDAFDQRARICGRSHCSFSMYYRRSCCSHVALATWPKRYPDSSFRLGTSWARCSSPGNRCRWALRRRRRHQQISDAQ